MVSARDPAGAVQRPGLRTDRNRSSRCSPRSVELIRWGGRFLFPMRADDAFEPDWVLLALDCDCATRADADACRDRLARTARRTALQPSSSRADQKDTRITKGELAEGATIETRIRRASCKFLARQLSARRGDCKRAGPRSREARRTSAQAVATCSIWRPRSAEHAANICALRGRVSAQAVRRSRRSKPCAPTTGCPPPRAPISRRCGAADPARSGDGRGSSRAYSARRASVLRLRRFPGHQDGAGDVIEALAARRAFSSSAGSAATRSANSSVAVQRLPQAIAERGRDRGSLIEQFCQAPPRAPGGRGSCRPRG